MRLVYLGWRNAEEHSTLRMNWPCINLEWALGPALMLLKPETSVCGRGGDGFGGGVRLLRRNRFLLEHGFFDNLD
jgi:hypothetical protein